MLYPNPRWVRKLARGNKAVKMDQGSNMCSPNNRDIGHLSGTYCSADINPPKRRQPSLDGEMLCQACRSIDFSKIFKTQNIAELDKDEGHLICKVDHIKIESSSCFLCKFLLGIAVDSRPPQTTGNGPVATVFGLYAFSGKWTMDLIPPSTRDMDDPV